MFYHVAKQRGISAAARKMPYGIQQPAISGQIAQLEKNLGTKLFQRRPFVLAPAGAKLFAEIEPFFSRLADLPGEVRGQGANRLRLAAPAIILREYFPEIFDRYKRRYPNFRLTLFDANQAEAEDLLRRREIDLAITELEGRPGSSVKSVTLLRLPLALVVPQKARFRRVEDFFAPEHSSTNLIALRGDEVITKQFQAGLKKLGLAWSTAIEVSSLELVELYVALGFGAGISILVPRPRKRRDLRFIPLRKFPPLTVAALWTNELSELAATFLRDVQKLAGTFLPYALRS